MSQYDDVRGNLIEMLEDLDDRLKKITDDVKHFERPLNREFFEQAVATENDQVLDGLGNATRDEIDKVKQAISRIDSGTYGICLICGQPIKKEHLQAMPHSQECIHCLKKSKE